jgi:hypothetical protein
MRTWEIITAGSSGYCSHWAPPPRPTIRKTKPRTSSTPPRLRSIRPITRIIHEYRREAFETEARLGFSQVRPTEAYLQSVEEAEREKPSLARGLDDVAGIHE